jgi:hypothetical protein
VPSQPKPPRGAVLLVLLSRLPRWVVLIALLVVVVAGLSLPGALGAVLLLVVAVVLGWLLRLAWPVLPPPARLPRLLTIALVVGYAGWKALH